MSKSTRIHKIRTKENGRFRSRLIQARSPKTAGTNTKIRGRILSIGKVSREELLGIGDFFKLGERLMKEFREEEREKFKREVFNGESGRQATGSTKGESKEIGMVGGEDRTKKRI